MQNIFLSVTLGVLGLMPLAACETHRPPVNSADPADIVWAITGKEWVVENLMDQGVPDRARATLTFTEDGKVSGSTGCNQYSGPFEVEDWVLTFGPMITTRRACFGALMDMEQKFLSVFSAPVQIDLDTTGLLRLQSAAGSLEAR